MNLPDIRISVALVTRNRPESLNRCLKSLRSQSVQPFEVVVSDDSDPEFAQQTEAIARSWDCKYILGPHRGLYANRNHVALACLGTHIRTMDDDHEFPEHHFEKCLWAIETDPEVVWIIGEYLPGEEVKSEPPPCPGQLHPRGFSVPPSDPQVCWAIADGASIYPKVIFERGIRYAEYFNFGAAYLEFGSRLYWLGYRIRYLESTYVVHHLNINKRSFMDKKNELSSRLFAMFCHSFIYQQKIYNQILCTLETIKQLFLNLSCSIQALIIALIVYNKHKKLLRQ